jgi:hypothetical protein
VQSKCVQLIHILKLGIDHDRIKIYIYFATAKSVFYFSESNGQLRDLKLPLDSYTTPRRSLLRGVCLPPILFLLSDAGLLAVSARPFILSAWVLVVASTTHHLDGNGFIRGHPLLTKRAFKELSLLRLPRYTMVKTGVKMGNVSLIVSMLVCLLVCKLVSDRQLPLASFRLFYQQQVKDALPTIRLEIGKQEQQGCHRHLFPGQLLPIILPDHMNRVFQFLQQI